MTGVADERVTDMARGRFIRIIAALAAVAALPGRATSAPVKDPEGRSKPVYADSTVESAQVPMSDGASLFVQIRRPVVASRTKVPVILTLSPYNGYATDENTLTSGNGVGAFDDIADFFVPRGYARAIADVRGTHNSSGCWDYGGKRERRDAFELVEWLAKRSWSSGRIGMIGGSYDGTTALQAAAEHAPHLAAIVPIASVDRWYDYAYNNGVRWLGNDKVLTDEGIDTPVSYDIGPDIIAPTAYRSPSFAGTLSDRGAECGRLAHQQRGYSMQPDYDSFWSDRDYRAGLAGSRVPALIAHGYQDYNVKSSSAAWQWRLLKGPKRIVFGQWTHANPASTATGSWMNLLWRWFDQWLLKLDTGVTRDKAVQTQDQTGAWHADSSWPPKRTGRLTITLGRAGGGGVARKGAQRLSADEISPVLAPAPGTAAWMDDPSVTEDRMLSGVPDPGFLRFAGLLDRAFRVVGEPIVNLRLSSDQMSSHVVVLLADGASDGTWTTISRGFLDTRYRRGLAKAENVDTTHKFDVRFTLQPVDFVLKPGHTIAIIIGSSDSIWAVPSTTRATNTLYMGTQSYIDLPLAG